MSSHGDGMDALSPGGANKVIRMHEGKMGAMSSDLASEVSSKRKGDMADRADIEEEERTWNWNHMVHRPTYKRGTTMRSDQVSLKRKGAMADMHDREEAKNTDRWFGLIPPYVNSMRRFQFRRGSSAEEIRLKVYRCLLIIALSGAQRLAITDRFGTTWSFPFDIPGEYSIWNEFLYMDRTPGLASLNHRCAWEAKRLVEMVDTGILSNDKWLWEYLLTFDGSAPHIVAAIYQSLFLYDLEHLCHDHPFIDESMKDMLVVGKLTIMLYREIHLHHFSGYFAEESRRLNRFYRDMLSKLIKLSLSDFGKSSFLWATSKMDPRTSSNIVEWLKGSIKETVDDVRARARAQPGYIPDENKLPSSDEVWNRAKSLKERLDDFKLYATDNNDEDVLVRNMPVSILCSAAAQELDLSICQRFYNKQFVLSKLEASKSLDLDYINELGGLVCVIEAVKVETGVKVCSCIIKDNLAGFLICMDVGNDRVDTKRRIFVEEAFRYVGTLQVTVTKERTTIESLQEDGSYFQGDFKDFSFGNRDVEGSCAAKALSGLPGSDFLQQSGLQCTALHMIALAICAGAEESIQLQWNGERGHIDRNEVERYIDHSSKEGGFEVPYSECCMLYTEEGRELARDVLWGMESLKRRCTPQPASSICNPSKGLIQPKGECCGQQNGNGNSMGLQPSMSSSEDHGQEELVNSSKVSDVESGEETLESNVKTPSTSDVGIQVSTIASTSTEALREAATGIPCPPEAIGEDKDDTTIVATSLPDNESGEETLESNVKTPTTSDVGIQVSTIASTSTEAVREVAMGIPCPPEAIGEVATSLPDRDERLVQLLREALTKMMYPPEAPTIEEKEKLDDTAIAAVLIANKRNFSAGFSILGFGLHGSWDCRPSNVDLLVKEYIKKQLCASAYERLTMVPPKSRDEVHRHVESKFMNGSLKEDKEEYLVIRNAGDDTCVQVFLCDHSTKELIFLTDIAVGDGNIVTSALNSFRGSWLEARRVGSNIHVFVPHAFQSTQKLRYVHKILPIGQNVLKKMGKGPAIEGFPRSEDQWKHIIGARRDHEERGLYWNATEMEAVVCAATRFTTGNAAKRILKHFGSELHGGCTSSNVPEHRIPSSTVCAIGRFSNFKGLGLRKIYWG